MFIFVYMKQLLYTITAGCFLLAIACTGPQQPNAAVTAGVTAETQLVKDMFAAFNRHDWTKMASYYSDTALFLDPSFGKVYVARSRQQVAEKYAALAAMFPDIKDDVQAVYASGDHVTVEFISSGSSAQTGPWTLPICTVLTVQEGKITKDATYYDQE